ncbi:MAG: hypothetical protein ACWGQW_14615, partial [bacterium]
GQIISDEPNRLLVAIHRKVGYVYWFEPEESGSTRLRHLIDTAANIQEGLLEDPHIPAALDALSARAPESPGFVVGLLSLLGGQGWITGIGQQTIKGIKDKAERAARKANWTPQSD